MEVLKCKKCKQDYMHEHRVYNDMAKSTQVNGYVCKKCGEWRDVKYTKITPADEKRLRKRVF